MDHELAKRAGGEDRDNQKAADTMEADPRE
jgi:hypothetical protein